jgi:hypothetical protein
MALYAYSAVVSGLGGGAEGMTRGGDGEIGSRDYSRHGSNRACLWRSLLVRHKVRHSSGGADLD